MSLKIKRFAIGLFILSLLGGLVSVWDYTLYPHASVAVRPVYFTGQVLMNFSQVALLILIFGCILFLFFRSRLSFRLNLDQCLNAISCLFKLYLESQCPKRHNPTFYFWRYAVYVFATFSHIVGFLTP